MPVKKKAKRRPGSFLARVQRTPKMKSVRGKIAKKKRELKKLSREYKATLKKESKRLK